MLEPDTPFLKHNGGSAGGYPCQMLGDGCYRIQRKGMGREVPRESYGRIYTWALEGIGMGVERVGMYLGREWYLLAGGEI